MRGQVFVSPCLCVRNKNLTQSRKNHKEDNGAMQVLTP